MTSKSNKKSREVKKAEPKKNVAENLEKETITTTQTISPEIKPEMVVKPEAKPKLWSRIRSKIKLTTNQIVAIFVLVIAVGLTIWISFGLIPYITDQTDDAIAARDQKAAADKAAQDKKDNDAKLAAEAQAIGLDSKSEFTVDMQIQIADEAARDIKINMNKQWAPQTVENFLRLTYRGYYDNMLFHRMVKEDNFKVIQGGDPTGDGSGGETASGDPLPDELWSVKPVVSTSSDGSTSTITNDPQFIEPSLYANFDKTTGNVTYRKGLVLMAKTQSPDSATSQFFITLDTTILPAQYTVFGVVSDDTMPVLDTILNEVNPVPNTDNPDLTKPDKDVRMIKVSIVQ
jgi:cyclophilin family peptidyl-prolyl cis-trans isomerase